MNDIIHANPMAEGLFQVYAPIARKSLDRIAGIMIDLLHGLSWQEYSFCCTTAGQAWLAWSR
jgi:hypothetical protein